MVTNDYMKLRNQVITSEQVRELTRCNDDERGREVERLLQYFSEELQKPENYMKLARRGYIDVGKYFCSLCTPRGVLSDLTKIFEAEGWKFKEIKDKSKDRKLPRDYRYRFTPIEKTKCQHNSQ